MKFYVIEIATGDSKIAGKGVYEYATLNEALAAYHSKMGTAMKSELYAEELLLVVNSAGGVHVSDHFTREAE